MRAVRRIALAIGMLALVAAAVAGAALGAAPQLGVSVDRPTVSSKLGGKFVFHSTIANRGSAPAAGLIAHLEIVSLRPDVYVDPEDWSSNRVRYLPTIAPGSSATVTWHMHSVNGGRFGVFVTVLRTTGGAPPAVGPTIQLAVSDRKTLNSGGILPLALGVPAFLGLSLLGLKSARRRHA